MAPTLHADSELFTARTAFYADWIDDCVRDNIETALKMIEPYRVVSLLETRPYHVVSGGWLTDLNRRDASNGYYCH